MTPFNPDGWMDFVLLVVIALIGMVGTVLPVLIGRGHSKKLVDIEDQVVNNHTGTLRDDIDKLNGLLVEGFHETRQDIQGLREEIRTERVERIEGDRRGMRRSGVIEDE